MHKFIKRIKSIRSVKGIKVDHAYLISKYEFIKFKKNYDRFCGDKQLG